MKAKPFQISKQALLKAYQEPKKGGKASGVDGQTWKDVEANEANLLYKTWNRMASGSYMPPPVRLVEVSKPNAKMRMLGIPTVLDRVAQTLVKQHVEPILESIFHESSYGYRPHRSAHQAVESAKQNCRRYPFVVQIDIAAFFDTINRELTLKALRRHTNERWVLLYTARWLKASLQLTNGERPVRTQGTPQGGVISPILANLYLHYTFDAWMRRSYGHIPFERYADDIVCHCKTRKQAHYLLNQIIKRFAECDLKINSDKSRVVLCRPHQTSEGKPERFDFLGFTFQPRVYKMHSQDQPKLAYFPAICSKAAV